MSTDPDYNPHDDVAALLREIPLPPTRITTEHAISMGRKAIRRRRRGITAAAAAAVVAATAGGFTLANPAPRPAPVNLPLHSALPTPSASPSPVNLTGWTVAPLPLLDGTVATVAAMDSTGRYIAGTTSGFKAIVWDNLSPRLLPPPSSTIDDLQVVNVNSTGSVVGNAAGGGSSGYAWVYRDGAATKLPAPRAGGRYLARDINDRGDILGWSERSGPILWRATASRTAAPTVLSNVDDAYALGDDGSVGGTANDGDHPVVLSPTGQARRMAELPGKPGGKVFAISGNWACGWVPADTDSNLMSARWNMTTGELTPFPSVTSFPVAISASGAFLAGRGRFGSKVLVLPDGTIVELPTLSGSPLERGTELDAVAITADGTMIAGNQSGLKASSRIPALWRRSG